MKTFLTTMNMSVSKMLVLLVIFGAICWDKSQVMAFSSTRNHEGSQYGKHFVIGFTEQQSSVQTSGFLEISIVTIFDTTVTIRAATSNNFLFNSFVKAGQVIEYKPPVSLRMNGTNIERKGIEVNSTKDVAIICLNHARGTADAYLALPTDALGTVYVVASYKSWRSNIGIISGNDGTKICITLNTNGTVVYRGISYYRGSPLCVNLQKLETFHIKHPYDLSGTIIVANKPISVISGDTCMKVGVNGYCDHVAAFLLPVRNWGKEFILASTGTMNRNTGDLFRIFAYENNTVVRSAYGEDVLSSGEFKEIDLTVDLVSSINCSKPCQVIQYTRGKHINGKSSDPSMIVLPSVGQFLSYYHVVLPAGSAYADSITLFIEESHKNGLVMNGSQITGLQWQRIKGTEYIWVVLSVSGYDIVKIYHSSREIRFGLLVFGWEHVVSYGYPGGFTLTDVNPASPPIFTTIKPSHSKSQSSNLLPILIGLASLFCLIALIILALLLKLKLFNSKQPTPNVSLEMEATRLNAPNPDNNVPTTATTSATQASNNDFEEVPPDEGGYEYSFAGRHVIPDPSYTELSERTDDGHFYQGLIKP